MTESTEISRLNIEISEVRREREKIIAKLRYEFGSMHLEKAIELDKSGQIALLTDELNFLMTKRHVLRSAKSSDEDELKARDARKSILNEAKSVRISVESRMPVEPLNFAKFASKNSAENVRYKVTFYFSDDLVDNNGSAIITILEVSKALDEQISTDEKFREITLSALAGELFSDYPETHCIAITYRSARTVFVPRLAPKKRAFPSVIPRK